MRASIGLIVFFSMALSVRCQVNLRVLGTVQDAGAPQIGCSKSCCIDRFNDTNASLKVCSIGLVDNQNTYIIDATPDFTSQNHDLNNYAGVGSKFIVDGVFLTHAHIGHYTGLMYLGREALGAKKVSVYAMPKFVDFIENNGPWEQLVALGNINLKPLQKDQWITLSDNLSIKPLKVPHRDEYSETVGYLIQGPKKSALFIPDIDKWSKWSHSIVDFVKQVDYAFLDATFYDQKELPGRDMSEIPHPFAIESMKLFSTLNSSDKSKIYFIHLNHTNPLLNSKSKAYKKVIEDGYNVARINQNFSL
ncbi:MBL fold metallo-hydrolase [Flavobacteriaceae bacterium]|nr:MBL fold metallo-hydrolase [Flavobacteriaceae bacterium]